MSSIAQSPIAAARMPRAASAVFLDKDGTLIDDVPFNVDPALVTLAAGARAALARLSAAGFRLIVVSNQSGIADGRFAASALAAVEDRIRQLLAPDAAIDAFYYCPHAAAGGCDCRKPAPGLLLRAAREHGIALERSWLVGDILDDVEAGCRAGCRTALIVNGNETEWEVGPLRMPDCVATSLYRAAQSIVTRVAFDTRSEACR